MSPYSYNLIYCGQCAIPLLKKNIYKHCKDVHRQKATYMRMGEHPEAMPWSVRWGHHMKNPGKYMEYRGFNRNNALAPEEDHAVAEQIRLLDSSDGDENSVYIHPHGPDSVSGSDVPNQQEGDEESAEASGDEGSDEEQDENGKSEVDEIRNEKSEDDVIKPRKNKG